MTRTREELIAAADEAANAALDAERSLKVLTDILDNLPVDLKELYRERLAVLRLARNAGLVPYEPPKAVS